MKPNWKLIIGDLVVVGSLILAIRHWNDNNVLRMMWGFLFVYTLIKQLYNHYTYYNETKKYY